MFWFQAPGFKKVRCFVLKYNFSFQFNMDGIAVSLPSSIKSPINSYARSPLVSVPSFNDPAKSHWEGVHSKIDTMTRVVSIFQSV